MSVSRTPQAEWASQAVQLSEMGVTHLAINTMGAGYANLQDHLAAIKDFKTTLSNA